MVVFLVIVAVVLACVVFVNVQACLFYLSAYAKATKRGFLDTMRDPHARAVYALSRRLAPHAGKTKGGDEGVRLFFDVVISCADARAVMADLVLVSAEGIAVACVQEGRGTLFGNVDDGHWLLVGPRSGENSEHMVSNLGMQTAQAASALREYLLLEDDSPRIVPAVVLGFLLKAVDVDVFSGVVLTGMKDAPKAIHEALGVDESKEAAGAEFAAETNVSANAQDNTEVSVSKEADGTSDTPTSDNASDNGQRATNHSLTWDAAIRKRVCRMIKACANAGVPEMGADGSSSSVSASDVHAASASGSSPSESGQDTTYTPRSFFNMSKSGVSGKGGSSGGILRSIVQRGREESGVADLVRKADRLAASKEDFDALTWERILEIGAELEGDVQAERTAELAAELRLIARTNVSLNYRFGIAQPSAGVELSPAGLVVESSVKTLDPTPPDPKIHEAIEQSSFFDDSDEEVKACVSSASSNESGLSDEDSRHTQEGKRDNPRLNEAVEGIEDKEVQYKQQN